MTSSRRWTRRLKRRKHNSITGSSAALPRGDDGAAHRVRPVIVHSATQKNIATAPCKMPWHPL